MSEDEVHAVLDAHLAEVQRRLEVVVAALREPFDEANRLAAEAEARAAKAERALDERRDRSEERAERQVVAWERIAAALEAFAAASQPNEGESR